MGDFVKLVAVSFAFVTVAACQTTPSAPRGTIVELKEAQVEIISVLPETDGHRVVVRDQNAQLYTAVISPPNLGPNSNFDFDHVQVGHRMIVSGEIWSLGNETRLTIADAQAI